MNKIQIPHCENNRIVVIHESGTVHFFLEQRASGERTYLFSKDGVSRQSSLLAYLGERERTIRELYCFRGYHNHCLSKIIDRRRQMTKYAMEEKKIIRLYEATEEWKEAVGCVQ